MALLLGVKMYLQSMAARYGVKPGDKLIVLTTTREDGSKFRWFYVFETDALWEEFDGKGNKKPNVVRTIEPWDGKEGISFSNGD